MSEFVHGPFFNHGADDNVVIDIFVQTPKNTTSDKRKMQAQELNVILQFSVKIKQKNIQTSMFSHSC